MLLSQIITRTSMLQLALDTCISIHSLSPDHVFREDGMKDKISDDLQVMLSRVTMIHDFACAMQISGQTKTTHSCDGNQQKLVDYLESLSQLEEEANDLIEHQRFELEAFRITR